MRRLRASIAFAIACLLFLVLVGHHRRAFAQAPPDHFLVTAPATATAGTAFNITVTAQDLSNATDTYYGGTVHITSTDGAAVLPADAALVAGVGTFSVTLKTGGSQTVTAADTAPTTTITPGTSGSIAVAGAAATHLAVTAPSSATAGSAFTFTVKALDQFNNAATGYAGLLHVTSNDGAATLPADAALASNPASLGATLRTSGTRTLTVTDTANAAMTATSGAIAVSAAAATHFTVNAPASAVQAAPFNFIVTALDAFSNVATGYAGTVQFTSTDGSAILAANSTLTSGTGTFSATLQTVGTQTITGTDTVAGSVTGTSAPITVSSNLIATTMALDSTGSPTVKGESVTFTATVTPASGSAPTGSVVFTVDGTATPGKALDANGKATLTVATLAPASHAIVATYAGNATHAGSTASLTQVVEKAATTTSLVIAPGSGQDLTLTATVAAVSPGAGTPTGSVHWAEGGTAFSIGILTNGVAVLSGKFKAGSLAFSVSYIGDTGFLPSASASTSVVVPPSPADAGTVSDAGAKTVSDADAPAPGTDPDFVDAALEVNFGSKPLPGLPQEGCRCDAAGRTDSRADLSSVLGSLGLAAAFLVRKRRTRRE